MIVTTLRHLREILPDAQTNAIGRELTRRVRGFSTDTRSLTKGEVFVALAGERFNGHDYVAEAFRQGATAAIVSSKWFRTKKGKATDGVLVAVNNTLAAYGQIAAQHRESFSIPVVAIAGSNGKTTTKDLIAELLSSRYNVLKTDGNLNNYIGVPATLLRLRPEHTVAVIEVGTNMPGEIATLSRMVSPSHGLITSIGREHLELLGSIDGVAREEGALFQYLADVGGTPIVSLDDPYIARLGRGIAGRVTYGRSARAHIGGRVQRLDRTGAPSLQIIDRRRGEPREITVQLRTPGRHSAGNALAAAAVALTLSVPMRTVAKGLQAFTPRIAPAGYARLAAMAMPYGTVVLNDTYNANPDSTVAAIDTLAAMRPEKGGIRIAVLADMLELGASSAIEHRRIAETIAANTGRKGIDLVLFYGPEMQKAWRALRRLIPDAKRTPLYFDDVHLLVETLGAWVAPQDVVLVKGSRGMRMERVVQALMDFMPNP